MRGLEQCTLLPIRYFRVVGEGQNNTHYCLLDISEQQERIFRTIHITVYQISQSSRRGLEQYTLVSIRYLRVVGEGQNNTHYCLLVISEQQERARTIHITVYQISQSSRRGLEQYTLLSIRYLRVVGEGQNNAHYCLLDISEQQERAGTIHITVYRSNRRGLIQYTLRSIRYLRVVGEGQNNTHYCLLDISDQQERNTTIHITVYQVFQSSRRGLEQYTLLSSRYLRVVGEGQNNTHYCLLDISEQQERDRTIHISVYQIPQNSRRGLEQCTLLPIRYLRVVGEGQNNTHYCLLDISDQQERARVYQISQSSRRGHNTHYCLLDISEQQEKASTLHIIVNLISQISQNYTHCCLLDISEQQERARTIHIIVNQISQISRRGLELYTLLSIRYLSVVREGQNNTHYCLLDISEQQERVRTIHITVQQISQSSRRGLEQYTLLSIRYLRVVGEGQNNTHYCLLDISEQQERARTIHITVYQISQSSRRGLEQYTLLSIRYLRVVGEGQNNTHYCLLDISEQQERARTIHITVYQISQKQQERARTIHITVYQISQISRRGLEQYTLLSIRYLRVVGEGQNNTHYCLLDISEQQERARTIHITDQERDRYILVSQSSRRGLEQYTLLSIRYLRVVGEGQNNTHYCLLDISEQYQNNTHYCLLDIQNIHITVVGEGQNNTHYCLLDISEQQERARTIHITVYQISQISRRGQNITHYCSISGEGGLEQYTLLSIRYLRVVGEGQNNTHYCLLDISDQQERARTIHITVYQISQSSRRGLEQYTLLSIRYLRVVGEGQNNTHYCLLEISEQQERARTIHITVYQISQSSRRGQNNTHYCLLDISEQQERARTIHITVYQISQSSRRGLEQYTLLSIRYLRVVGEGQNNTHYCLLDISEQQERARTIHITVYQLSHILEQYTLLSIRYLRVVGEGQNNTHYCLLDISIVGEGTIHILSIRYLRVVGEGQNNTHYCLLDISEQQERARTIHITVYQISQSSRRGLEQYTLVSIRYRVVGEGQNNTHYCLLDISEQQERARTIHITVYQISQSSRRGLEQYTLLSIRYLRVVGEGQNNTHYCLLDISEQQERARTIHITVYQISQSSRRGLEQYTLLSIRYLRVVERARTISHQLELLSIRYLRVVGEGQNNTHYCLLDISDISAQ